MKKKQLLLTNKTITHMKISSFFCFLIVAVMVTAQNCPTNYSSLSDTIGDLTGYNPIGSVPFNYNTYYSNSGGSWTIYTRESLADGNIHGDCYINSITLFGKTTGINPSNIRVYMLETPKRFFNSIDDSIPLADMELVATVSSLTLSNNISGVTIPFNTPFHYTGQGHLAVAFKRGSTPWNSNIPSFVCDETGFSICWNFEQPSNFQYNFIHKQPVIVFNRCENANALMPVASVTTTPAGSTSATVSWQGNASLFEVVMCEDDENPDTVSQTSPRYAMSANNSFTFNGLRTNRRYTAYVRSLYGTAYSAWVASNPVWVNDCGGTMSARVNYMTNGNHSNYYLPFSSSNWITGPSTEWTIYNQQILHSLGIQEGSQILAIGYKGWNNNTEVYRAPLIRIYMKEVSANTFNSISDSIVLDSMTLVHTSTGRFFDKGWTFLPLDSTFTFSGNGNLMVAVERVGDNVVYGGTDAYFSCTNTIRSICSSGGLTTNDASAPIIALVSCSDCTAPDSMWTVSIRDTTARLAWNPSGIDSRYILRCLSADSTHTLTVVADNPTMELMGLLPNTTYQASIASICSIGDTSSFSEPIFFTTDTSVLQPFNRVQIGDEYNTTYSYYSPINSFFQHSWVQMIYPSASISRSGYIDTLWFKAALAGGHSPYDTSATIYMGHTSMETHLDNTSWLSENDLTMVIHASSLQPTQTGWFAIPLENPFYYNGQDNLVIVAANHCTYWTLAWQYYYEPHTNAVLTRRHDNDVSCGNHPGQNPGGLISNLPLLRLSISQQRCSPPRNLHLHDIADSSATLSWTESPSDSLYIIKYRGYRQIISEEPYLADSGVFVCSSTSYTLSGLHRDTHYNLEVNTICTNGDTSNTYELSFHTTDITCAAPSQLRVIDCSHADNVTIAWSGNAPLWQVSYGIGINSPRQGAKVVYADTVITMPTLHAGRNYNVFVRPICGAGDTGSWAGPISFRSGLHTIPSTRIGRDTIQGCNEHIEYTGIYSTYSRICRDTIVCYPASEGNLVMVAGTMSGYENNNSLQIFDGDSTDAILIGSFSGHDEITPTISTYGPLTLVWTCTQTTPNISLNVDMLCIPDNGCHASPRAVACHPLDTSAFLHWTVRDASPTSYSVAYGLYDVFDTCHDFTYQLISGISDTNLWITHLIPGQHYRAAIRSECDSNTHSRWTLTNDFYTNCIAIPRSELPYHQDFSSWDNGNVTSRVEDVMDSCFHIIQNGAILHQDNHSPLDTMEHYIYFSRNNSSGANDAPIGALILPLFEDNPSDLTISYKARMDYNNNDDFDVIEIGVMDNPVDVNSYTPLCRDTLTSNEWTLFTKALDMYNGDSRYIAFSITNSTRNYHGFRLADIVVYMDLPCMPPSTVILDSVTTSEATLHIVDTTTPDSRTFAISRSSNILDAYDSVTTTETSCTFTHLDEGTHYYVWVRNTLEVDRTTHHSPWTGPISFSTLNEIVYYRAQGVSEDPTLGTVSITPQDVPVSDDEFYPEGTVLVFYAESLSDQPFWAWDNGATDNPLTLTLTQDTLLTALFGSNDIILADKGSIRIIPNPANDNVTVISEEAINTIICYDMNGRQMMVSHPHSKEFSFNVHSWPLGTYIVKTIIDKNAYAIKLIVK